LPRQSPFALLQLSTDLVAAMPAALSRPIKVGTDCSGMETPLMALKRLGVGYKHMFSCDIDRHVKAQLLFNFPAKFWYDDLMARDNTTAPKTDLYVAGFPCQSFSGAGLRKGFKDKRGMVFYGCCDYIENALPRAFILENVKGILSHDGGNTFEQIMHSLTGIGNGAYEVQTKVLNSIEHGVPQSRPRVYLIGIRKDCKRCEFSFPEPLPPVPIESALDPVEKKPTLDTLPGKGHKTAYYNVKHIMATLHRNGKNPLKEPWIIDLDSTPKFATIMYNKCPCMTKSRANGFWISNRGRRMNPNEMLRCQGMERSFKQVVSDRAIGAQIGNAMSQNIIERILISLLPAAGLVTHDVRLVDRWARKVAKARTNEVSLKRAAEGMDSVRKAACKDSERQLKRARTA